MTDVERQRRSRQKRGNWIEIAAQEAAMRDAIIAQQANQIRAFRAVLTKIGDRTSERMRTKEQLQQAMDAIGSLAASALSAEIDLQTNISERQ